jgi:hypothetical protein
MLFCKRLILKPIKVPDYLVFCLFPNCTISWSRNWNHVYVLICMLLLRDSVWVGQHT